MPAAWATGLSERASLLLLGAPGLFHVIAGLLAAPTVSARLGDILICSPRYRDPVSTLWNPYIGTDDPLAYL